MKKETVFKVAVSMLFVVILSVGCSASDCQEGVYVEYKPIFIDTSVAPGESPFVIDESRVDAEHYENIKIAFDHYKLDYKVVDNKIMMDCRALENKETMANVTRRADDESWIESITYAEYQPLFYEINPAQRSEGKMYFVDKSKVSAEHYENIKIVLEHYEIKHKVVGDKIMIDRNVDNDDDTMVDLTKKAEDKEWIKAHRKK